MEALLLHTPSPIVACCSTRVGLLLPKSLPLSYESTFQQRQACCTTNTRIQINIQHQVQTKSNWLVRYSFQPISSLTQRSPSSVAAGAWSSLYWVWLARDFRDYLEAGRSASCPAAGAASLLSFPKVVAWLQSLPLIKCTNIMIAKMHLLKVC